MKRKTTIRHLKSLPIALAAATLLIAASLAPAKAAHVAPDLADAGHKQGHGGGHLGDKGHAGPAVIGRSGMPDKVTRTIDVMMYDNYYEPDSITVREGETIRFRLVNKGQFLHEFGLGTQAMHKEHQKQMLVMMEHGMIEVDRINHERMKMDHGPGMKMQHEHANSVMLEPGKAAELIWAFGKPAKIELACNIPGHYESGMVIDVNFAKAN